MKHPPPQKNSIMETYQSTLNGFIFVLYALNRQETDWCIKSPPPLPPPYTKYNIFFNPNTIRVDILERYRDVGKTLETFESLALKMCTSIDENISYELSMKCQNVFIIAYILSLLSMI